MKKAIFATLLIVGLASLSMVAVALNIKVNERITFKKGESKVELKGELSKSQKSYVYSVRLEKGQNFNLAAVFRGNFTEKKPNAVFRDNLNPVIEVRGLYKSDAEDAPPLVGSAKDGEWSGTVAESGDYLIIVSRPVAKEGGDDDDQAIYPYKLLVWTK